jgi:predicted glutamine amidotransferase
VCELLAVAFDEPRPFGVVLPWARDIERLGIGGFGWGVAWLGLDGTVQGYRHPTSMREDPAGADSLAGVTSTRFLVHHRRPNRLSTVQMADTQPFVEQGRFAFCHNGSFERHAALRDRFAGRLHGRADSEVGFAYLNAELGGGLDPAEALTATHRELGGTANLGYLGRDGRLLAYGGYPKNAVWAFVLDGASVAATGLHSDDGSLFDLVFPDAKDRHRVEGDVKEVGGPGPR